jgi:hypothetical protein
MFGEEDTNFDTTSGGAESAAVAPAADSAPAAQPAAAAAPAPSQAQPAVDPSRTAQILATPQQEPLEGTVMNAKTDNREPGLGKKMLTGILGALGGTEDVQYSRDPQTGKLIATHVRRGPGDQWKRIVAGGLLGAVAGASVRPGPGHLGRAAAAGLNAGMGMVMQQDDKNYARANDDFEAQQKTTVAKAQVAHLNQLTAESVWKQIREKSEFQTKQSEADIAIKNLIAGDANNEDLGIYGSFNEFLEKHGDNGGEIGRANANKELRGIPEWNADGSLKGVHIFRVTKAWDTQRIAQDTPIDFGPKFDKDGKMQHDVRTIPAGSMTNGDVATHQQAATARWGAYAEQKATTAERNSTAAKNYAEVGKIKAETAQLSTINTEEDAQSAAQQLVDGRMDPSQLSKRASKGSNTWNHIMKLANDYSLKTTGKPFDVAQATSDYKYATNANTQNVLRYLNGLTGTDNKSGNLGTLMTASAGIPRATQFPPINDAAAWAKLNAGDPKMAAYHAAVVEVSDQVAKILQGGGSGNATSDKKLEQATELFRVGFTNEQINETATTLRDLLGNRKKALIEGNRYLEKQFGGTAAAAPGVGDGAQAGEQAVYQNNKLVGYTKDGKTISRLPQ